MGPGYQVAKDVGNNIAAGFTKAKDENAIESILSQALNSGSQEVLNKSITQILSQVSPERQGDAVKVLQNAYNNVEKRQKEQQILHQQQKIEQQRRQGSERLGLDPDLHPDLQKIELQNRSRESIADKNRAAAANVPAKKTQASQPIDPEQLENIKRTRALPGFEDLDEIGQYRAFIDNNVSKENAEAESKLKGQQLLRKQQVSDVKDKRNWAIAEKVLERADVIAEQIPQKQTALDLGTDAIANGDLSFWSWDNLAELTGVGAFRTPEGAIFKTAAKEYFLGNISRAGARPNQWIEQQISDMLAKVGNSTEANLSINRSLQNELDLDKERVRVTNELADKLESEDGNMRTLGSKVQEHMSQYAEDKQKELFNDLRAIKSISEDKPQKFRKVKSGTIPSDLMIQALVVRFNNDPNKAMEEARKLGYSIDE